MRGRVRRWRPRIEDFPTATAAVNYQRSPWPFLYHGLEQEYPDSWKLYWEPGGNVYNPDPFQLSLTGPQGLGGGGGAAPRSIGFGSPHAAVNWVGISLEVAQNIAGVLDPDVISIGSDPPLNIVSPYDPFNLLAGLFQGGIPSIPWFDITHTSRGAHPAYCGVQGICGAIVTQQGNIVLAQSAGDPEGGGGDEGDDIAREGDAISQVEQFEQQEKILNAMGRPSFAYDDRGFLTWLRQMEDQEAPAVTAAQANAIAHEARRLGLEVRLDPEGHDTVGNPWTRPHLNIMGHTANVHMFVPNDYKLP